MTLPPGYPRALIRFLDLGTRVHDAPECVTKREAARLAADLAARKPAAVIAAEARVFRARLARLSAGVEGHGRLAARWRLALAIREAALRIVQQKTLDTAEKA